MSRRYSPRTVIEAGTPQAWVAHWWKDEWAEETMNTCERVYWTQRRSLLKGAYTTPRFSAVDEHFREWLIERALEFRAKFDPFRPSTKGYSIEKQWYAALHSHLTYWSQYHFNQYTRGQGMPDDEAFTLIYTTESVDHLTEEYGDALVDTFRSNSSIFLQDPLKVLAVLETLLTGPTAADFAEALKAPSRCRWEQCQRLKEKRDWCGFHYTKQRELWGIADAAPCSNADCVDYAVVRGFCMKHYQQHRAQAIANGTWRASTSARDQPCSVDGCDSLIGARGARGMCQLHYGREQYQARKARQGKR